MGIPLIDLRQDRALVVRSLREACQAHGFFCVTHHGVPEDLQRKLELLSQQFFALDEATKLKISMDQGGIAWRGFFPVGGELTSGKPDLKEGLYFGQERQVSGVPLHGPNLFPELAGFRETVLRYMEELTQLGHRLMELLSEGLNLDAQYFRQHFTADPTILFRIFHYPPVTAENKKTHPWGVGTHTDYGLLTILKQDDCGGLEVHTQGKWVEVPPVAGSFVCNIGDMLDYLTQGRYRSTPHRVRNTSGRERYSFPFFFDPSFAARVSPIQNLQGLPQMHERWDHADLYQFQGTYGDYLIRKVSKVFPALAATQL